MIGGATKTREPTSNENARVYWGFRGHATREILKFRSRDITGNPFTYTQEI